MQDNIRTVKVSLQDLLTLIAHYTQGEVPTSAEAMNFGPHSVMNGWWGIESRVSELDMKKAEASEFVKDVYVFQFRYQGGRLLSFADKHKDPEWRIKDEGAIEF